MRQYRQNPDLIDKNEKGSSSLKGGTGYSNCFEMANSQSGGPPKPVKGSLQQRALERMKDMNKHASVTSIVNVEPSPYENKAPVEQPYHAQDQDQSKNVFKVSDEVASNEITGAEYQLQDRDHLSEFGGGQTQILSEHHTIEKEFDKYIEKSENLKQSKEINETEMDQMIKSNSDRFTSLKKKVVP